MDNNDSLIIQGNNPIQIYFGYIGGSAVAGDETDPIYTADKPNLALKTEIPTKTSDLQNDSGFISNIPQNLVTEQELNNKGYLTSYTQSDPIYTQDKPNIALKSELFSKSYNDLTDKPDLYTPKTDGDGSKFLADNGQYKTVQTGTDIDLSDYTGAVKLKLEDGTTFFQRNTNINQLRIGNFNTDGIDYNLSSTDIFSNYVQTHAKQFKIQVNNNGEINNTLDVQNGYIQIGAPKNNLIDLYGNYLKWYQQNNQSYPLYGVDFSSATEFKLPENTTINGNKIGSTDYVNLPMKYDLQNDYGYFQADFSLNYVVQKYLNTYAIADGILTFNINAGTATENQCPTVEVMIPYTADITTFVFQSDIQQIQIPQSITYNSEYTYNYAVFVARSIHGKYYVNYSYSFGENE